MSLEYDRLELKGILLARTGRLDPHIASSDLMALMAARPGVYHFARLRSIEVAEVVDRAGASMGLHFYIVRKGKLLVGLASVKEDWQLFEASESSLKAEKERLRSLSSRTTLRSKVRQGMPYIADEVLMLLSHISLKLESETLPETLHDKNLRRYFGSGRLAKLIRECLGRMFVEAGISVRAAAWILQRFETGLSIDEPIKFGEEQLRLGLYVQRIFIREMEEVILGEYPSIPPATAKQIAARSWNKMQTQPRRVDKVASARGRGGLPEMQQMAPLMLNDFLNHASELWASGVPEDFPPLACRIIRDEPMSLHGDGAPETRGRKT